LSAFFNEDIETGEAVGMQYTSNFLQKYIKTNTRDEKAKELEAILKAYSEKEKKNK
jgi:hypothetical protein